MGRTSLILVFAFVIGNALQAQEPADQAAQIEQYIEDLSSDNWKVRDEATTKLTSIGKPAIPFFEKSAKSDDPEVAARVKAILTSITGWKVALAYGGGGIRVVDIENGTTMQITTEDGDCDPALSADGKHVVFVRRSSICIADIEGAKSINRIVADVGDNASSAWSPDGKRIAFVSERGSSADIHLVNVDGTEKKMFASNVSLVTSLSWSPNGGSVAFVASERGGFWTDIYVKKVDGSERRKNLTKSASSKYSPAWSPDGKSIAFASTRDRGLDQYEIYIMDADGANVRRLTDMASFKGGRCHEPIWSPDGKRLAFRYFQGGNDVIDESANGLYTIDIDGSNLKKVETREKE